MVQLSLQTLLPIALCLSSFASAAPVDGLTKRAPKVLGLDFDVVKAPLNETLLSLVKRGTPNSPLINKLYYYITYLLLGSNKQKIGVDIDTGSSDLWVPNSQTSGTVKEYGYYDPSKSTTAKDIHKLFKINYGDKTSSTGEFYTDTVSLGDGSGKLSNFQFASISLTSVSQSGILGIGLNTLEANVVYNGDVPYNNFPLALKNAGYIDNAIYSLYLNTPDATGGSILFGGKDVAKIDGPLITLQHSGEYNRLDITVDSVTVAGNQITVSAPFNLDSGSTVSYFPTDSFNQIVDSLGGDTSNLFYKRPTVACSAATGNLSFTFHGITIDVPLSDIVLETGDGGCFINLFGTDEEAILGDNFLRRAYVIYNLENSEISLGKPKYTTASSIVSL